MAILEPSVEEFAFVTPRDAGSPFFAVSIKYRVNIYLPNGKLADSWGFTGYGTAPAQGLSSAPPLQTATALAMRDAGAKLAVEFREQATVRGLLPGGATADSLKAEDKSEEQPVNTQQPLPVATGAAPAAGPKQEDAKDDASQQATPAKDETPKDETPQDEAPQEEPPAAAKESPPGS
jgi:hypothetical protein